MRQVYVNGTYLPESEARVSVFDRGFLFADGVYEVTLVLDGKLVDFAGHMARLRRSLSELEMPFSLTEEDLLKIHRELVRRNDVCEGLVYLQVTRGAADRSPPTMFAAAPSITASPSSTKAAHRRWNSPKQSSPRMPGPGRSS
nr:aminotransferase class IV [Sinorhizobium meliloti]